MSPIPVAKRAALRMVASATQKFHRSAIFYLNEFNRFAVGLAVAAVF
jgi:hypothetical protein